MLKSNLAIFTLLLFFLSGCSESIRELESRIKKQAEKNNTEMSAMEIKQTAIYLNEWSKEDFFQDDVNEFLEADKADFPEGIEILFAGSSSIRFWKSLEKDMNPLNQYIVRLTQFQQFDYRWRCVQQNLPILLNLDFLVLNQDAFQPR